MLNIENHLLKGDTQGKPVSWGESPNHNGIITPKFLVFHYTGCSFETAKNTFLAAGGPNPVSAHLLVDTDGSVMQFVPFNQRAWHAGNSSWDGYHDINTYSIGIEVVNYGYLHKTAAGGFARSNGKPLSIVADNVIEAQHKNPGIPFRYWQAYPPEQLQTCRALAELLVSAYQLTDVVGHDDIAPHRKEDPGPAFPLLSIKSQAFGRAFVNPPLEQPPAYVAVPKLNIRTGPSVQNPLAGPPLIMHTKLSVISRKDGWLKVDVVSSNPLQGWVSAEYTRATPTLSAKI